MAKESTLVPRNFTSKSIKRVVNKLLHRGREASTQVSVDENRAFDDVVDLQHRRRSVDSSHTYLAPDGTEDVNLVAELDEMRRQKLMTDKYEQKFLGQKEISPLTGFCESCSRINFEGIYEDPENVLGESTAFSLQEIGIIDESWSKRTCRLCKFFAGIWAMNKSYLRSASLCLVVLSSENLSKHTSFQTAEVIRHQNLLLLLHPQPHRFFDVDPTTLDNLDIVGPLFLSRPNLDLGNSFSVRAIKPDRINFSVVRGWLQHCSAHHGKSCFNSEVPNIPGFQLLNCQTRKLEPYVSGSKFTALSYVWGTNVNEQMHQANELGYLVLPQTIEDALQVTLEIGFQYLWVDRYCIPQFDDSIKHIQIANMDLVYNCATLTIVATCGQNSSFGLPGVGRRSRLLQSSCTVGEYDLVSALSNPVRDVRDSQWMCRGWTYQEALLSKRRLIFTEKQVYFECGGATSRETVAEPEELMAMQANDAMSRETHYGNIGTLLDTRHRLFPADYLSQINADPWLIQHRIAEYTTRSLTFDSDILNAFLGVLRKFTNPECTVSHVWGVPVLWSSANWSAMEGLATGLCWIGFFPTLQGLERRPGFPSWSWTGWKMPVSPRSYFYRYGFKTPYEIKIDFETEQGKILDWATYQTASQAGKAPVLSQYLHIENWSLKCHLHADLSIANNTGKYPDSWWLTIEGSTTNLYGVVIHKQYSSEDWNAQMTKVWDILLIGSPENPVGAMSEYFEQYPPFGPFLMILEDMGEYHERIGYLDLAHSGMNVGQDMSMHLAKKKRRSFKLG